ncbi:MAG: phosphatase PAP2 family protein [Chloroflexota bacterium]
METAIEWIFSLQAAGGDFGSAFFRSITFLGDQEFYLVMFPLLFWCIDTRLGIRVAVAYLVSTWFNLTLKELFQQPRPFHIDPAVGIIDEVGYGMPSNHAQATTVIFGVLAHRIGRRWGWITAGIVALLVGFSRIYLGVHFPLQVILGWTIGIVFLWFYITYADRIESSIARLTMWQHLGFATLSAIVLSFVTPFEDNIAAVATLWGLWCGTALLAGFDIQFSADGTFWQKVGRFLLGSVGVALIFAGLRAVFPDEGEPLFLIFRFVRYGLIGLFVGFIAPWLFSRAGLASSN